MKPMISKHAVLLEQLPKTSYFLQPDDLEAAAKVMAAAFSRDPSIRYLLGGKAEGPADWRYFLTVLKAVYGKCLILSSDSSIPDLLVLFPPELKSVPTLRFFLKGGLGLCRFFGPSLFLRSLNYEKNCQRIKARFFTSHTWYCLCFVVQPDKQGQGRGSRLIRPVLQALENSRLPLYLETHKEVNTHIYQHLGFRTVDISTIPGTTATQYAMLRGGYSAEG